MHSIPITRSEYWVQPPSPGFVTVDGHDAVDLSVSLSRA